MSSALSYIRFTGCDIGVDRSTTDLDGEKVCCVAFDMECACRSCDGALMLLLGLKFVRLVDAVAERAGVRGAEGAARGNGIDGSAASRVERRSRASATIRMAVLASAENSCEVGQLSLTGEDAMSRAVQIPRTAAT